MWRGLMLTKAVEQFLADVAWGELDYLLIDMPPGTGDVQMGLARLLPRTSMIIVTTPALAAQKVAQRAADMARRSFLPVVGVIENMSAFTCDHGETYALFGAGGGQALADDIGAPLLGQIPLEPRSPPATTRASRWRSPARARRPPRSVSIADRILTDIAPPATGDDGRHGRLLGANARRRRGCVRRPDLTRRSAPRRARC